MLKKFNNAKDYAQAVAALLLLTLASVFIALTHLVTGKNPLEGVKAKDDLEKVITG